VATQMTDVSVHALGEHCTHLQSLTLRESRITGHGLVYLTSVCDFRKLEFYELRKIKKDDMEDILKNSPNLRSFCMSNPSEYGMPYGYLGEHCPHLEELAIVRDESLGTYQLNKALPRLPNLRKLILTGCRYCPDEETLAGYLKSCPLIEWIDFSHSGVDDGVLACIAQHCPRLRVLLIWSTQGVTDKGILAVARACPQLVSLNVELGSRGITDEGMEAVKALCPKLRARQVHSRWLGEEVFVHFF
jgi:hypothetical protein